MEGSVRVFALHKHLRFGNNKARETDEYDKEAELRGPSPPTNN